MYSRMQLRSWWPVHKFPDAALALLYTSGGECSVLVVRASMAVLHVPVVRGAICGEVLSVLFGWDSGSGLAVGFQGLNFWLLHEVTPSSICFSCDKPSATLLDFSKPSTRYLQPPRPRPQSIRTSLRGWVTQHLDLEVPDCQNSEKS